MPVALLKIDSHPKIHVAVVQARQNRAFCLKMFLSYSYTVIVQFTSSFGQSPVNCFPMDIYTKEFSHQLFISQRYNSNRCARKWAAPHSSKVPYKKSLVLLKESISSDIKKFVSVQNQVVPLCAAFHIFGKPFNTLGGLGREELVLGIEHELMLSCKQLGFLSVTAIHHGRTEGLEKYFTIKLLRLCWILLVLFQQRL